MDASAIRLGDGSTLVAYTLQNGSGMTLWSRFLDPNGLLLAGPLFIATEFAGTLSFSVAPVGPRGAAAAWDTAGTASVRITDGQGFTPAATVDFSGYFVSECRLASDANALALACNSFDPLVPGDVSRVRLIRLTLEGTRAAGPWLAVPSNPDAADLHALVLDGASNSWIAFRSLTPNATGRRDLFLTAVDLNGNPTVPPLKLVDAADGSITAVLARSTTMQDAVFAAFVESVVPQVNVELHLGRFSASSAAGPVPVVFTSQPATVGKIELLPVPLPAGEMVLVEWIEDRDADSDTSTGARHPRAAFALTGGGLDVWLNVTAFEPLSASSAFFVEGGGDIVERGSVSSFHRVTILPPGTQLSSDSGGDRWLANPFVVTVLLAGGGGISLLTLSSLSDRFKWLLLAAVWPLYVVVRREQVVLDNMRRGAILQVVQEAPGIRLADVSRRTGIAAGALRHHLVVLEEYGFISRSYGRHVVRLYPAGKNPIREQPFKQIREQIVAEIRKAPGVSHTALSRHLGVKWATLLYHVEILQESGLVEVRRSGRKREYWPLEEP